MIKLKDKYLKVFNQLIESIINDKKYINELVSYLEEVKIKCPPKYEKYEKVVLDMYRATDPSFSNKKFNKKIMNDLTNINFHKLSNIIINKLNIPKEKKDNAIKQYKKILSTFLKGLQKGFIKSTLKKSTK